MRVRYRMGLIGAIGLLFAAQVANAAPVRFTGQTGADERLSLDVAQHLATIGKTELHCDSLEAIRVLRLPASMVGDQMKAMAASAQVEVEGWTTTLCGKRYLFKVVFWLGPSGTPVFAIDLLGPAPDADNGPPEKN